MVLKTLAHERPKTYHEQAQKQGPTLSTAHATHTAEEHAKPAVVDRPAGKSSVLMQHWGIQ